MKINTFINSFSLLCSSGVHQLTDAFKLTSSRSEWCKKTGAEDTLLNNFTFWWRNGLEMIRLKTTTVGDLIDYCHASPPLSYIYSITTTHISLVHTNTSAFASSFRTYLPHDLFLGQWSAKRFYITVAVVSLRHTRQFRNNISLEMIKVLGNYKRCEIEAKYQPIFYYEKDQQLLYFNR